MTSKRTTKSPPFMLTERDYDILGDIALCGGLTAEQIGIQHFTPTVIRKYSREEPKVVTGLEVVIHANCQKRMKLLRDHGYVRRVEIYQRLREGKKPYVYFLTRFGAETVASYRNCTLEQTGWRERETRLRPNYISHHLRITDIRLAVMRAIEQSDGITLVRWYDEVELAKIHSQFTVPMKIGNTTEAVKFFPDACFVLAGPDGKYRYHFVEYDAGTETTMSRNDVYRTFAHKVRAYMHFLFISKDAPANAKTLFQQVYEAPTARVLTVTASAARRARLLEVSENVGARRLFWFTSHPQLITPTIVEYPKKRMKDGTEVVESAYRAVMPNILSDPIWLLAQDENPNKPEHPLDEPFRRVSR